MRRRLPPLLAFNAASAAETLSRRTDQQVIAEALAALRALYVS